MTIAIETHTLCKTFGSTRALDGVDLTIHQGTVYGLLGPNGAGKTTTERGRIARGLRSVAGARHVRRQCAWNLPTAPFAAGASALLYGMTVCNGSASGGTLMVKHHCMSGVDQEKTLYQNCGML